MKYIDAERLSEKIESIGLYAQKSADYNDGRDDMKMMVLDFIDSLQQEQPKEDLEKEIEKYFKGWVETDEGIACHYQYVDLNTCYGIACHFYQLGLNAKKEEKI